MSEVRDIPGFPGYSVSDQGVIYSRWRGGNGAYKGPTHPPKELKHAVMPHGYHYVALYRDGKMTRRCVHDLVLSAFVCERPEGADGRHLDGDRANNVLSNLAWGTRKENMADCIRHGRTNRGTKHPNALLDPDKVRTIRAEYAAGGIRQIDLAQRYGVTRMTVSDILTGRTWSHVQ